MSWRLDGGRCRGCGLCAVACPWGILTLAGGKARLLDPEGCDKCGICERQCPFRAIDVIETKERD